MPKPEKHFLVWLVPIALAAFTIRCTAAVVWQDRLGDSQQLAFGDSDGYLVLAENIAKGKPYQYGWKHASAFRTPGYPALLAPLFWMGEGRPILMARIVGAVLGSLATILLGILARRLVNARAGIIAAMLMAFYPGAIASSVFILAEAPFFPLMLLALLFLARSFQHSREETESKSAEAPLMDAAAFGFCSGLAILVRPSWLLFPLLLYAFLPLFRYRFIRTIQFALVSGIVILLVLAPWTIRNYQVLGALVPTTTQTGSSLYDGLRPSADGSSDMSYVARMRIEYLAEIHTESIESPNAQLTTDALLDETGNPNASYWSAIQEEITALESVRPDWNFESAFDAYLRNESISWARGHPGEVIKLALNKLLRMWSPSPNASSFQQPAIKYTVSVSFILVVCGAIAGWIRGRGQIGFFLVTCLPAVYFTLLHMIFVSSIRYREPAMILFLIPCAALLAGTLGKTGKQETTSPKSESI